MKRKMRAYITCKACNGSGCYECLGRGMIPERPKGKAIWIVCDFCGGVDPDDVEEFGCVGCDGFGGHWEPQPDLRITLE